MIAGHASEAELDALAFGEPCDAEAARHAGSCLPCAAALAGRRRERSALATFSSATDGEIAHLWAGVEARLPSPGPAVRLVAPPRPATRRRLLLAAAASVSAAAALFLWAAPDRPAGEAASADSIAAADDDGDVSELTSSASAALAQAQAEYQRAAEVLELQVVARHRRDGAASSRATALGRARLALTSLHAGGADPRARVRLLEGYSTYLRSLRRELDEPRELE